MTTQRRHWHLRASFLFALLLVVSPLPPTISRAQGPNLRETEENDPATVLSQITRPARAKVAGGAAFITAFARLSGLDPKEASPEKDSFVPLVSILRDPLGDDTPENNRLRYVWPLTYTRPTTKQRLAAAIPFFYTRVGNKEKLTKIPPPALDLASPESEVWDKIFWTALQSILLDPYGTPIKASTSSYRRNTSDYRRS